MIVCAFFVLFSFDKICPRRTVPDSLLRYPIPTLFTFRLILRHGVGPFSGIPVLLHSSLLLVCPLPLHPLHPFSQVFGLKLFPHRPFSHPRSFPPLAIVCPFCKRSVAFFLP
jgi:hypothetical protein